MTKVWREKIKFVFSRPNNSNAARSRKTGLVFFCAWCLSSLWPLWVSGNGSEKTCVHSLSLMCLSDVGEGKTEEKTRPENGWSAPTLHLLSRSDACWCLTVCWPDVLPLVPLSSAHTGCCRFGVNDPPHGRCLCVTDQHEVQEEEEKPVCRLVVWKVIMSHDAGLRLLSFYLNVTFEVSWSFMSDDLRRNFISDTSTNCCISTFCSSSTDARGQRAAAVEAVLQTAR